MLVSSSVSIWDSSVEPFTNCLPSRTTVPVATASRRLPTKWPNEAGERGGVGLHLHGAG